MSPKAFHMLLPLLAVCACAASASHDNKSARGRMFAYFDTSFTDEPFTLEDVFGLEVDRRVNGTARSTGNLGVSNVTAGPISEEVRSFLTGRLSTLIIPSFYAVVCLLAVPVNACAALAFSRRIRPKKPAAIYMLNLACADLLFAGLLPFKAAYHFAGNDWVFGECMCRVVTAAFYWNMYCSVLLVACISVDRLLAVVYPIDSLAWRRPRNAVIACVAMWVVSLAGSVPLLVSEQTFPLKELDITTCHDVRPVGEVVGLYGAYFLALCVALFVAPLLVTVVSYTRVIWCLSRAPRGVPGRSRRRTRALVMALTVLVMFLLCFAPTNCLLLVHYVQLHNGLNQARDAPEGSYVAYLVFLCLGSLNCLLDPLLYCFGSSQCQRELAGALRCQKMAESFSASSSDSYRSSTRIILKSGRMECSEQNVSFAKKDSLQGSHRGHYKKLLV
ncbi:proteinase-activated receptor 1-like [Phyllopteryx taeniolatus]|uniref:proteinase-activated receptor 1-like n=1 Tax=Phyllopteryx taeniolatus TaxID=161469 RepID=UPI002AD27C66|nr:proteinase-activated receptor 1-like [Phyllopteryx taeniolatus]XP_061603790.1 proteinase-activated receptor 1-like [Phyllopteryx taeniolatus]XP_061603791.1 proteinase-activated receptor 1-like [Phyllopteryx taeniolatus]